MQKLLLALITLTIGASCSSSKELIKSSTISSSCQCEGQGDHTIVMEAGMGNWSVFYQPLSQKLKETNKVCLIDRPGYSMDTVTTNNRDLASVANELNTSLTEAGVTENIILIGHSLGGLHVRQYHALYPDKVEGMVLLDAASSDQFDKLPAQFHKMLASQSEQLEKVISLAKKGYLKYSKSKIPTFGLPESLLDQYYAVSIEPEYYYSMKMEVDAFEENLKNARALDVQMDTPLLVIGSKNSMDEDILPLKDKNYPFEEHNSAWFEMQQELSKLSTNSTFVTSHKNHYLHVTDAELVTTSINTWIKNNLDNEK